MTNTHNSCPQPCVCECVCVCVCVSVTLAAGEAVGARAAALTPLSHHTRQTGTLTAHLVTAAVARTLCGTLTGWGGRGGGKEAGGRGEEEGGERGEGGRGERRGEGKDGGRGAERAGSSE